MQSEATTITAMRSAVSSPALRVAGLSLALVLLFICFAVGFYLMQVSAPAPRFDAAASDRLDELQKQIDDLQAKLARVATDDILLADFEGPDYGNWTTTGTAFGSGPAQGTMSNQNTVTGFEGKGLVNTFLDGHDDVTGTLTSPTFTIERRYLNFLIGGGARRGTCINLLLDGAVVRSARGQNSESLEWASWDVSPLLGKTVTLQIADEETNGWGHINIDQITQSQYTQAPAPIDVALSARVEQLQTQLADLKGQVDGDIVLADFEGPDYGHWTAAGRAFGSGPAHGDIGNQNPVSGFHGRGLVNTFLDGSDEATGTLTSRPFKIERRYLRFLLGGGNHPDATCMNLLVNGAVVCSATGRNEETLTWCTWDLAPLMGQTATLQIVDNETGPWGHINVDQITESDVGK